MNPKNLITLSILSCFIFALAGFNSERNVQTQRDETRPSLLSFVDMNKKVEDDWSRPVFAQLHGPTLLPHSRFAYLTMWTDDRIVGVDLDADKLLASQPQPLAHDRHQHVHRYRDPDLRFYCILAGPVERLDAQVLLDPFEEQFHLPATLVDLRDGKCGEHKIVGQELQPLVGLRVEVTYAPQCIGIHRDRFEGGQNHRLIRAHARALVHGMRVASLEQHVRLGAHDKEGRAERKDEEPLKIDVAPVHHVEGPASG